MNILSKYNVLLANPEAFWLLLLLPLLVWYYYKQSSKRQVSFKLSSTAALAAIPTSWKVKARLILPILELLAFAAIVVAMSRPQRTNSSQSVNSEGIDMVISLDISGSMLAEDFKPNRIKAAKDLAIQFIKERPTDRIGLVIFSGEAFTQCPITIDHNVLIEQLQNVETGMLEDGTAIGVGLGTAVERLRYSKAKSKVIILLTDGENNTGKIDPLTGLELAKSYGVRVYTVGIGTQGEALFPMPLPGGGVQKRMVPVRIDEPLLNKIAEETGGRYFRATGNKKLKEIYQEIDKLEKTKIEVNTFKQYEELFFPFAFIALGALSLSLLLRFTYLRSITS